MILDSINCSKIVDNLYDGVYIVDLSGIIQYWNKAAERISGYTASEVIGSTCSDNILAHVDDRGENLCRKMCPLTKTMADGQAREAQVFLHHKKGHMVPVSVRVTTLTDSEENVIGGVELFRDISSYESIEQRMKELEEMAFLDKLTGLANRNYLEKELQLRLEEQKRYSISFGLLLMDIDHFKKFNDLYGHDVGDQVLRFVAETLIKNTRPFDIIGRWGGEEFLGIIRNVTPEQLEDIGNRLRNLIESSFLTLRNEKLQVNISVGATVFDNYENIRLLLKRADTLLYQSKSAGRNRLTIG